MKHALQNLSGKIFIFYERNIGVKKVCGPCFHKSKTVEKSSQVVNNKMDQPPQEPLVPADLIKQLDSLENPPKPPIVMYKHNNHWDKLKKGLEPADQEIVERLRKLKEEEKKAPDVDEIRRRLAILKDEDPDASSSGHKINIHEVDTRTDQEKVDDLIHQYANELKLSSDNNYTAEVQARLAALQNDSAVPEHQPSPQATRSDDIDDDEVVKKILTRALAEAALEKKYEQDADKAEEMEIEHPPKDSDDEEDEEDDEDKPFCAICDKTENLKQCSCCNGDYYCPTCYAEIHND